MTHPALHSVGQAIEVLDAVLDGAELTILQRQILSDMRSDLETVADIDTFADVCELALAHAKRGYY